MGSADLLQTLSKNDLVDEMELMIIPITLGTGKRLFERGTIPAGALRLKRTINESSSQSDD